jgi:RNA polymerase sigma factor (sigma-70 family)
VDDEIGTWLKECYVNYYPMVLRRCREILRNDYDAENAAQDVFEKLCRLKMEGRFDIRSEGLGGLLYKMADNMSINQIRKKKRDASRFYAMATNVSLNRVRDQVKEKDMGTGEIWALFTTKDDPRRTYKHGKDYYGDKLVSTSSADNQVVDQIFLDAILKEEDEKTRNIFYMHRRDKMAYKEIGEVVGLSTAAVEKRLKKFEKQARSKLG